MRRMTDMRRHSDANVEGEASVGGEPRLGVLDEPAAGAEPVAFTATAENAEPVASAATVAESVGVGVPASGEVPAGPANAAEGYRATADEHVQTLKSFWKNFLVSGLFVVAAVVIILACLAWFYNNSQVNATGASVSAAGLRYTITAEGDRIGAYDSSASGKLDTSDSMSVSATSNLKNYDGSTQLAPGSYGSITFTVTSYVDRLGDITVNLDRYLVSRANAVYPVANVESNEQLEQLLRLLSGHILFFESCDDNGFYEKPMLNNSLTIEASAFEGAKPTSVTRTIYWIWPEHFRDFVLTEGTNYEKHLFAPTGSDGYSDLLNDINGDSWSKYFYPSRPVDVSNSPINVAQGMSTLDLQQCSDAYDAADEQIGNNVQYIQIRLTANEAEARND